MTDIPTPDDGGVVAAVEMPVAELTLWQASRFAADGDDYWRNSMPAIMAYFNVPYGDYWNLTVAEHASMMDFLLNKKSD